MRWICLNKIPTRARRFKPRKITMLDLNAVINLLKKEDVHIYQGPLNTIFFPQIFVL